MLSSKTFLKCFLLSMIAGLFNACAEAANQQELLLSTPVIISRPAWKAVEPDHSAFGENGFYDLEKNTEGWLVYDEPLSNVFNTIIIHHSALPLTDGPHQIQYLHMHNKGFADIGYHFVIDDAGQIYEGRSLMVRGAHTGGHNTGTIGVVLMGNFEENVPKSVQLTSMKTLINYLAKQYSITYLAGHRDFQPEETVCPGKELERLLPDIATELGLRFGTEGYVAP